MAVTTSIVKGFSDVIRPLNLAFNGNFRINQRGTFGSLTDAKSGDFVSDCWYVHSSTNVSYLQVQNVSGNYTSAGQLICKGYGKKGQYVTFDCVDKLGYGIMDHVDGITANRTPFTAAADIQNQVGYIPVSLWVRPQILTANYFYNVNNVAYVSAGQGKTAVTIAETQPRGAFDSGCEMAVQLLSDGEFYFVLSNFRHMHGGFINPPHHMAIPVSDDLLRCKRYYQTWSISESGGQMDVIEDGTSWMWRMKYTFPVEFAGTPSIAITSKSSSEGTETNVTANHAGHTIDIGGNITSKDFDLRAYKAMSGNHFTRVRADGIAYV